MTKSFSPKDNRETATTLFIIFYREVERYYMQTSFAIQPFLVVQEAEWHSYV